MIENSDMVIENLNWMEVIKYLVTMMTPAQIEEEGLTAVIPVRQDGEKKPRKITINYLEGSKNDSIWMEAQYTSREKKRKIMSLTVAIGVEW